MSPAKLISTAAIIACLVWIPTSLSAFQTFSEGCNTSEIIADDEEFKYNRSSLHLVLIESESFPQKDVVMESWENFPFPEKYDDHQVDLASFDPTQVPLTDEEIEDAGYSNDESELYEIEQRIKDFTAGIYDPKDKYMPLKIEKVIEESDLAKKLVAKWFNMSKDSTFNMQLVQDRGYYNATEMEAAVAEKSVRGLASLADAGEELINNTFVIFSKLYFSPNEPIADIFYSKALTEAEDLPRIPEMIAKRVAKRVYNKAKKGYSVWTISWLYKLVWNEATANSFYLRMWSDTEAFNNSDIFKLEYIGSQGSRSLVTFSMTENRTEQEIIDIATVRNIDNTYAQLQKEHNVFKPKVPIRTAQPLTAQIGLKEGLEGGERFEVLEMTINCDTHRTEYDVVDRVRVDEDLLWDNRYKAGVEENTTELEATQFTNPNERVQVGMLLRLIK